MTEGFPTGSESPDLSQAPIWEGESPDAEAAKSLQAAQEDALVEKADVPSLDSAEEVGAPTEAELIEEAYGKPNDIAPEAAPADPDISPYRR